VIYMVGNGQGKKTMTRNRDVREVLAFRTMVLSDGELSTRAHIESDKNLSFDAGAAARIHDIPADAGKGLGVFEDLHGASSPKEFAEALVAAASTYFGHHGRTVVEHLNSDRKGIVARVKHKMDEAYTDYTSAGKISAAAQEGRVVKRFALCAAVGEIAIELGVLPWKVGSALKGVGRCLADWLDARGKGSMEAIAAHTAFCEFMFAQPKGDECMRDRAFIHTSTIGQDEYWFSRGGIEKAVGQPQRVSEFLKYLKEGRSEEWGILTDGDGKRYERSVPKRVGGHLKRMVCIISKRTPERKRALARAVAASNGSSKLGNRGLLKVRRMREKVGVPWRTMPPSTTTVQ